jgi:hypothetical protein
MEATMIPQHMGQASYYYYNTENKNVHHQMGMYPMVPTLPSTPIYSRPNSSSCSQPPTLMSNGPSVMTPAGSPGGYLPSTPPLSTSGSTIGSPKSFEMLQTPMNPMFSGLDGFEGMEETKDILESAENCVLDWSSSGSPPMTPGKSNLFFPLLRFDALVLCFILQTTRETKKKRKTQEKEEKKRVTDEYVGVTLDPGSSSGSSSGGRLHLACGDHFQRGLGNSG